MPLRIFVCLFLWTSPNSGHQQMNLIDILNYFVMLFIEIFLLPYIKQEVTNNNQHYKHQWQDEGQERVVLNVKKLKK